MNTSKSILKSTGLIGGSRVISLVFNIIRDKAVAVLLGPTGTGFIGMLQSTTSLVQGVAGFGIQNSAVRDIARAHAQDQPEVLSKTIKSLRRIVLFTGLLGMVLTLVLARAFSQFTFETPEYTWEIRLLAVAVFFNLIKAGQGALIQGMRRIKILASLSIVGAALSSLLAIPIIYWLRLDGIAVYLVVLAIGQYGVSCYYAHKIKPQPVSLSWQEIVQNARSMAGLGWAFMGGSLATLGTTYLIRALLIREYNLGGAGLYQAAMAISGIYINIVLEAMGNDFYPRLTAVANQPEEEISLINEQTEIGMLLAAPGLLLTLALAPAAIKLLYTAEYMNAYSLLQWMILGVFMRTISWPMGYLFVARAKSRMFFYAQIVANVLHFGLLFFLIKYIGLLGAGIAFFGTYSLHVAYMYGLVNRENKYQWTAANLKIIGILGLVFASAFLILSFTIQWVGSTIVCFMAAGVGYFTLRKIMDILGLDSFPGLWIFIKGKLKK